MKENNLPGNDLKNNPHNSDGVLSIPVINEVVTVEKNIIETGKVKIKKNVSSTEKNVKVAVDKTDVEVKTVMINRLVDEAPEAVRYEGDTMIISELQEVCVVRLMLVKEIHITTKKSTVNEERKVTLRKEEVVVEKSASVNNSL